jgi:hypothetical protein
VELFFSMIFAIASATKCRVAALALGSRSVSPPMNFASWSRAGTPIVDRVLDEHVLAALELLDLAASRGSRRSSGRSSSTSSIRPP